MRWQDSCGSLPALGPAGGGAGMVSGPVDGSAGPAGRELCCFLSVPGRRSHSSPESGSDAPQRRSHCRLPVPPRAGSLPSICWINLHNNPLKWVQ